MALQKILDSIDELSEEVQKLYLEKDGKFHLDLEGGEDEDVVAAKKKIDEFRKNNIALLKTQEDLREKLEKFKDLDPVKYKEALEKLQKVDDQKMYEDGDIEELVQKKTERMKRDYEGQIKAVTDSQEKLQGDHGKLQNQFSRVVLDNQIQLEISRLTKPREKAMEDIIARGRRVFTVDEDGHPIARDPKTGDQLYSKDGTSKLTIAEWAENLPAEVPYFFEPSSGTGALGGKGEGDGRVKELSGKALGGLPPTERLKVIHRKSGKTSAK